MLLSNEEIQERIESPMNLLNRLRTATRSDSPSMPPKSEDIIDDMDEKIQIGSIRSKSAAIMATALDTLKLKLDELKPEKLVTVAAEMNKIVQSRVEQSSQKVAQVIVYAPQIREEAAYEVVTVKE